MTPRQFSERLTWVAIVVVGTLLALLAFPVLT